MAKFDKGLSEVARYKKKSTGSGLKKSNHKHIYEPCVLAYPCDWWNKGPLFLRKMNRTIRGYCPVCGKLGDIKDKSRWYREAHKTLGGYLIYETVLTEEGEREMNPRTRTLPYFEVADLFIKFVEI